MKGKSPAPIAEIAGGRRMKRNFAFGLIAVVILTATAAMADPSSRVARLQYVTGDVSVQPGGVNDWVAAVINRPLTTADRVWTDKDSRSELHLGGAFLRMNSETSLTLTNVSDEAVQIELNQGSLNLRVRRMYKGEIYEIDTPNLAFTVTKAGSYRFDVDPDGDHTLVTVWRGEGEATGEGNAVEIHKNQQIQFAGGTSLDHQAMDEPEPDGFDDWCNVRDRRQDESVSARYVAPDVIGYEDLDSYGRWSVVPDYGPMWVPAVAAGWAPYRYGHWVWIDPWGWTWVDDAPWGFAPSHYGRWVYYRGGWGWCPGPARVRPVYAPALVAWVGGTHWGVSMTFGGSGGVAWFPLGYGEPYIPPYHASRNYFQQVNVSNTKIVNITNVTNNYYVTNNNTTVVNNTRVNKIVYRNQNVDGAVTAVPRNVLVNSQPVGRVAVRVPQREIASVPASFAPQVAPTKVSVLGTGGQGPLPPSHAERRAVFTRVAPPERPIPFTAKQQALAANPGRPLDEQSEQQIRRTLPQHPAPEPTHVRGGTMPIPPHSAPVQSNAPAAAQPVQQNPAPVRPVARGPERIVPRPPQAGGQQQTNGSNQPPAIAARPIERPTPPIDGARGLPTDADKGMTSTPSDNRASNPRVVNQPVPRPPVQSQPLNNAPVQSQAPGADNNPVERRPVNRPQTIAPAQQRDLPTRDAQPQVQRPEPPQNTPRVERTVEQQQPRNIDRPVFHPNQDQRPSVQPVVREQSPVPQAAPARTQEVRQNNSAPARAQEGRQNTAPPARAQEPHHDAPAQQSKPAQTHNDDGHKNQQR
jgi:hypothetical protein